jgi:hypothetical protein
LARPGAAPGPTRSRPVPLGAWPRGLLGGTHADALVRRWHGPAAPAFQASRRVNNASRNGIRAAPARDMFPYAALPRQAMRDRHAAGARPPEGRRPAATRKGIP